MRKGALASERLTHSSEQKADSPDFVDFQQSIHDVQAAAFVAAASGDSNLCHLKDRHLWL